MSTRLPQSKDENVDVLGMRIHYVQAGSGRPLLLVHGLVGSSVNWHRNIQVLAEHANVFAIDMINAGKSERIPGLNAGLEATADRLAAAMDVLGLERADIAGHSHGGAAAVMLAARYPERVRSLILFAPVNPFCTYPNRMIRFYSTWLGRMLARCGPYLPRKIQLLALGRMYGDPTRIGEGCIKGYVDGLRIPGTIDHILAIVRRWDSDMELLRASLPLLGDVRTLLVWGDHDPAMSLASGMRLNQELSASELRVIPGGGHVVFEEIPEETNSVLLDWLNRNPPRPSPQT